MFKLSILTIITSLFSKTNPRISLFFVLLSLLQEKSNKSKSITGTILFSLLKLLILFVGIIGIKKAFELLPIKQLLKDFLLPKLYKFSKPLSDSFLFRLFLIEPLFINIYELIYFLLNLSIPFFIEP